MAIYWACYESVVALLGVDHAITAVQLGYMLTGKAAYLYISLPSDIKKALLTRSHKTPDGYQTEFRPRSDKFSILKCRPPLSAGLY